MVKNPKHIYSLILRSSILWSRLRDHTLKVIWSYKYRLQTDYITSYSYNIYNNIDSFPCISPQ